MFLIARRVALAAAAIPLLALAVPAVSAATAPPAARHVSCTADYEYSDGLKGVLDNIPYAWAKWTSNSCDTDMQVKVNAKTSCTSYYSGVVHGVGIKDEADGPSGSVYCAAFIRFKCDTSACTWHPWQRLPNTTAVLTAREAATARHAHGRVLSTVNFCLENAQSLCIHNNGAGNQLDIEGANYMAITIFTDGGSSGGLSTFEFKNPNGNCIRVSDDGSVDLIGSPCADSDYERWTEGLGNGFEWRNVHSGQWLSTNNDVSGKLVWANNNRCCGNWFNWAEN